MPKAAILTACIIFISLQSAASAADGFYVNPGSTAAQWVKANPQSPLTAKIQASIAGVPSARWLTGTSQTTDKLTETVSHYVEAANKADKIPILVAYNLPGRDCSGGASAGGAANAAGLSRLDRSFITGIGDKPAVVILEPDALADSECLPPQSAMNAWPCSITRCPGSSSMRPPPLFTWTRGMRAGNLQAPWLAT